LGLFSPLVNDALTGDVRGGIANSMSNSHDKLHEPITRVINQADHASSLHIRRARLRVVKGPDKGMEKLVPPHGLVVGTAPECNFVLSDSAISQTHFSVMPGETGFHLQDLGSRNGTWMRGIRFKDAYIRRRENIEIGYTTLRLLLMDGHEEYPLSSSTSFGGMIGRSVAMRQVFAMLERASASDATLLLEGESGTGKDLAAETVHSLSPRKEGPFVVVDCGSMQANLVESQLFGHRKGAFTGAVSDRPGAFEAADGGTVFLDEIGELDAALQPKLLRVLEKKQVQRLGENEYRPANVRVIAATNRDLETEMKAGRFRQDLYYRLSVLRVHMPALRDRREDVRPLAINIVRQLQHERDPKDVISEDVLALLLNHPWPGNVRELRNVIERLLLFPDWPEAALTPGSELPQTGEGEVMEMPFHEARRVVTERFEKAYLASALDACDGVVARAAQKADIPRQTFHRLMSKHNLTRLKDS
jgi:DNA-binding NtrC family response regulator